MIILYIFLGVLFLGLTIAGIVMDKKWAGTYNWEDHVQVTIIIISIISIIVLAALKTEKVLEFSWFWIWFPGVFFIFIFPFLYLSVRGMILPIKKIVKYLNGIPKKRREVRTEKRENILRSYNRMFN